MIDNTDVSWGVAGESGNGDVHYHTRPHNIHSTMQGMTQALHTSEHLRHVMGCDDCFLDLQVQFYVSSYDRA
ncbi:hypothetical protein HKD37_06G016218 [Glycine soja]